MKIEWHRACDGAWVAYDKDARYRGALFSMCKRGAKGVNGADPQNREPPYTRWCVFDDDVYAGYCGDVPIELPFDDAQAMAITLWRIMGKQ